MEGPYDKDPVTLAITTTAGVLCQAIKELVEAEYGPESG